MSGGSSCYGSGSDDWDAASREGTNNEVRLDGLLNAFFLFKLAAPSSPRPTCRRHAAYTANALKPSNAAVPNQMGASDTAVPAPSVNASTIKRGRPRLRDMLCDALCTEGSARECTVERLHRVAGDIETALKRLQEDSAEVAHGLVVSLSDPLNHELRSMVLSGAIPVDRLVRMDEESLLNPELRARRQRQRRIRLEQQTADFVDRLNATVTYMFECPACGGSDCFAQFRSADFVKWHGDDPTPTLLRCRLCSHSFRA